MSLKKEIEALEKRLRVNPEWKARIFHHVPGSREYTSKGETFSKEEFEEYTKNNPDVLYIILIYGEEEEDGDSAE